MAKLKILQPSQKILIKDAIEISNNPLSILSLFRGIDCKVQVRFVYLRDNPPLNL